MKITKYEHACLVIEHNGKKLVIDPGSLTSQFGDLNDIAGVVLTHVHFDHFNADHVAAILAKNPSAQVFGTAQIAQAVPTLPITAVTGDTAESVGTFTLNFFGEMHALVYEQYPQDQNVGVLVNNQLYYPGDSFTLPGVPVEILAVPTSGPWLKLAESLDFVKSVHPSRAFFATHDALLSEAGEKVLASWIEKMNNEVGGSYHPLKPGESIEA
jgi:L-ascorbate metabolism protein UlaG (beta-lactamase superfamily)